MRLDQRVEMSNFWILPLQQLNVLNELKQLSITFTKRLIWHLNLMIQCCNTNLRWKSLTDV